MSDQPTTPCTCLPLNRRLMATLLKVEEGSVHEQGCVENAVAAYRADLAAKLEEVGADHPESRSTEYLRGFRDAVAAVLREIEGEPQ